MTKNELRALSKKMTEEKSLSELAGKSRLAEEKLLSHPLFLKAEYIFVYISAKTEPSTDKIISAALESGKKVFVPVCGENGTMKASEITKDTLFVKNRFGISEPENAARLPCRIDFDLIIMPCVCADAERRRIGHGGGFYDRFCAAAKGFKVCLCFSFLVFPSVPHGEYDIRPDMLITDKEIIT